MSASTMFAESRRGEPFNTVTIALGLLAACTSTEPVASPTPIYTQVSQAGLEPGDPIPRPSGEVILTVQGRIGASNVTDADENTVQMDMATLESIGLFHRFDFGDGDYGLVSVESQSKLLGFERCGRYFYNS